MIADDPRWDAELLDALRRQAVDQALDEPAATLDAQRRAADAAALAGDVDGVARTNCCDRWVLARGRRVLVRVHRPRTDAVLPALVYLHGGGWVFGSLDTCDRLMRELALAGDVAVVGVDYALSPEAVFPQAAEECAAVFRQVMAEAATWGLDPQRMVLGGDSAGGNLAFATALLLRDARADPAPDGAPDGAPPQVWRALRGVLAIYPVCDSAMDSASYAEFATGYGLDAADMAWFWARYIPDAATRAAPLASVGRAALHALPPVLILAAELDVLCGEGEAMAARLREAGVAVCYEVARGAWHGFLGHSPSAALSRKALSQAGDWLRERCRP